MNWPIAILGEVSEFIRNGAAIKQYGDATGLAITRIETIAKRKVNLEKCGYANIQQNEYVNHRLNKGDILISHINSEKHLGKCAIFESERNDIIHGMNLLCLRPSEKLYPKYAFYYLSSVSFLSKLSKITKKSVNQASFTTTSFKELEIPLPPLPIQKQIAAVLEKADTLREQCQQMEQELNALAQSVFLDMFGEPTNYSGKTIKLKECLFKIESGWSPKCKTHPAASDTNGVLKLGAVTSGIFKEYENKEMLDDSSPKKALEVKAGDLLFTRKNTFELVAATAYVRTTRPNLYMSDLIFRFAIKDGYPVSKVYLWALFSSKSFRQKVQSLATGAAASMPNISKSKLEELDIPLPPIQMQQTFENIIQSLWNNQDTEADKVNVIDTLFQSLMQRAFKGELALKDVA